MQQIERKTCLRFVEKPRQPQGHHLEVKVIGELVMGSIVIGYSLLLYTHYISLHPHQSLLLLDLSGATRRFPLV